MVLDLSSANDDPILLTARLKSVPNGFRWRNFVGMIFQKRLSCRHYNDLRYLAPQAPGRRVFSQLRQKRDHLVRHRRTSVAIGEAT